MCNVNKGNCHYKDVPAGAKWTGYYAGAAAQPAGESKRIKDLERQIKELKESEGGSQPTPDEMDGDGSECHDAPQETCTAAMLVERKQLYLKQGSVETDPEVVDVVARLQAIRERKMAEQPGHVRIHKAEAFVLLCKGKLEKSRGRTAAAAKQLEEARKAEEESEEKLKQATADRDSLFADLGRVAQGTVPSDPGFDSMPEGDFVAEGTTKEGFIQLAAQFQQIHAKLMGRQQQRTK